MREYETIYVLKPDLPGDQVKTIQEKLKDIITKGGGHILHHVDWGKRRLAYRVEKFTQAQYLYLQYLDQGASVAELERILKYDDRVLKFLTVKVDEKVNQAERLARAGEAPLPPEEVFHEEPVYDRPPRDRYGDRRHHEGGHGHGRDASPADEPAIEGIEE
ncbi:MAG: 30S ribosomal protein S6 [Deltaproteobacteria bacterium]|nr:30S ribosomal protein S6 [Deltaproteobacteria bacterium]